MDKLTKKKRALEFLTVFTAVVGTIIGVGIYVKNDNQPGHVLGDVQNPIVATILWTFVGIVVFMMMIFFLEIASSTLKTNNGTLSTWVKLFLGRRTASMVSIYYVFIYLPINYGFFATIIVSYILAAAGNPIDNVGELLGVYLSFGTLFIVFFSMLNAFLRDFSKLFQIVGTIVKLIPIFLVLIAIAIPDTVWGVFFNADPAKQPIENGGRMWSISLESIDGLKIFSGFSPILFAFNGFISAANLQGESENKELVGRAILWGVGFSSVFYVLVTLGLFLGSKDGSVVSFFEYMLNGFRSAPEGDTFPQSSDIATLVGNLVLATVCLISINSYTLIGPSFFHGDANSGIIFANNRRITLAKAAIFQMALGVFFFVILVVLGVFSGGAGTPVSYYFDQASNAGGIIGFTFYALLIIGGLRNRKTKKVAVVKLKNWIFWSCGIISISSLTFMLGFSYIDFFILSSFGPNRDLAKPIAMFLSWLGIAILWVLNEIFFKKVPFNMKEAITTFPIPKPQKRFVWVKKSHKNSKIKVASSKK